jgi:peroxiredoxin
VVRVVGLGTQDSFEEAQEFVERHGTKSFSMLWDPSFASWRQLGITGQPAAILFDREGRPLERWVGPFDEGEVLDLARKA